MAASWAFEGEAARFALGRKGGGKEKEKPQEMVFPLSEREDVVCRGSRL